MNRLIAVTVSIVLMALGSSWAQMQNPFSATAELDEVEGIERVRVSISVPADHYLYVGKVTVEADKGGKLLPENVPTGKEKHDELLGKVMVYEHDVVLTYRVEERTGEPLQLVVNYQGCSGASCYPPITKAISFGAPVEPTPLQVSPPAPEDWEKLAAGFTVVGRQGGYLRPAAFVEFLEASKTRDRLEDDALGSLFKRQGIWAFLAMLLIVLGGLGLNLTPCVLPMIPINIAIIGAGAGAGSRSRGFALGAVYGLAMAMVYGVLGFVVVKTGAKFGALNSSVIFNIIVSIIFVLLGLAMFDVISIDLSRFQGRVGGGKGGKGKFATAFLMGGVAALLAGACVAPVVVSVLLLATDLVAGGQDIGLVLPFLLGLGMGLPWPFLGAGLSIMPEPGRWMMHVKHGFGIVIIGFALYFGYQAARLRLWKTSDSRDQVMAVQEERLQDGGWYTSLPEALKKAREENKPVLIDFWASWCKNCLAMEKTFKDESVKQALGACINLKYRAEDMSDPGTKRVLDYFLVPGLPTYVVLKPNEE